MIVESQFKYCLLIWMFHSRYTNNKINRLHERALQIVYNNYESSFEQLLVKDRSFCVHHQSIHRLMIEIFKVLNNVTDNVYNHLFVRSSHVVSLQYQPELIVSSVNSALKMTNSLRYFGSIIWNSLPVEIRKSETLSGFKLDLIGNQILANVDCVRSN